MKKKALKELLLTAVLSIMLLGTVIPGAATGGVNPPPDKPSVTTNAVPDDQPSN